MQENRNSSIGSCSPEGRGTVCIDTRRILDCCRDKDCFENARVYLTSLGEDVIANATNIRCRTAKLLWAYVGVDEVAFNRGFFRVTVRYYIKVELEGCLGIGRSQAFSGISVLEKDVILYGGEGSVVSYTSSPENNYCNIGDLDTVSNNDPVAVVETIEPVVLGTKVIDPSCGCGCNCIEYSCEIPEGVCNTIDGVLNTIPCNTVPHLYMSFGIFSVIRIERPAQLLVQATDYSVPDKECVAATNDENPCTLFGNMPFPTCRFTPTMHTEYTNGKKGGGCGCSK